MSGQFSEAEIREYADRVNREVGAALIKRAMLIFDEWIASGNTEQPDFFPGAPESLNRMLTERLLRGVGLLK